MKQDDGVTLLSIPRLYYDRLKLAEETLKALEWVQGGWLQCEPEICPVFGECTNYGNTMDNDDWCYGKHMFDHAAEWLKAYRERGTE